MTQSTDEIASKKFRHTRLREGYDQDEVDAFQHSVVTELLDRDQKILVLEGKLAAAEAAASPVNTADEFANASTNNLLTVARRLYESHVAEGLARREEVIGEGRIVASRLISESESHLRSTVADLNNQREEIQISINSLTEFEKAYHVRLKALVSGQLESLDKVGQEAIADFAPPTDAPVVAPIEEEGATPRRASFLPPTEPADGL